MSPAMITFSLGVVVGGLGGIFLVGLLFLAREQRKEEGVSEIPSDAGQSGCSVASAVRGGLRAGVRVFCGPDTQKDLHA